VYLRAGSSSSNTSSSSSSSFSVGTHAVCAILKLPGAAARKAAETLQLSSSSSSNTQTSPARFKAQRWRAVQAAISPEHAACLTRRSTCTQLQRLLRAVLGAPSAPRAPLECAPLLCSLLHQDRRHVLQSALAETNDVIG
jgi:hypothetical protein